jgi:MFS family permease
VLYIKREFQPGMEGLLVATSLIGATIITTFSGPVSDSVGRRPMLIASSLLYSAGSLIVLWSPNVFVLLLSRLVHGFGIGLAVTLVPVYISETAPPEIRGMLNTLPQFTGSGGMCHVLLHGVRHDAGAAAQLAAHAWHALPVLPAGHRPLPAGVA